MASRLHLTALGALGLMVVGCGAEDLTDQGLSDTEDGIVGGVTEPGTPSVVALLIQEGRSQGLCTATVIAPRVLLTAAHCVYTAPGTTAVFSVARDTVLGQQTQALAVERVAYNPQFSMNDVERGHDTAVVILKNPIDVPPMPFNKTPLTQGMIGGNVRLVGYGLSNARTQTGSGTKRQATTRLNAFNQVLVQAGDAQHDTCNGDSGGPAFMTMEGVETIIGITSFGPDNCGGQGYYTRVDTERAYIESQIATVPAPVDPPPPPPPPKDDPPSVVTPTPTPPPMPTPPEAPETPAVRPDPAQQTPSNREPSPRQEEDPEESLTAKANGFSGKTVAGGCVCVERRPNDSKAAGSLLLLMLGLARIVRPRVTRALEAGKYRFFGFARRD